MRQPAIFAHRGASGQYPENTMRAFKEAKKAGVAGIELDVQLTKEGQVVVIHDETLDRTTTGAGYVMDMTLEEIKKLDAGSWFSTQFHEEKVPTLEEVFQWLSEGNHNLRVNIELKNYVMHYKGLEEKVLALIEAYHLEERIIISSFNAFSLQRVRMLHPTIEIGYLIYGMSENAVWIAEEIGANAIHCQPGYALSHYAEEAKKAGFPLRIYTVNNREEFTQLREIGVDVIMTDYPARLHDLQLAMQK